MIVAELPKTRSGKIMRRLLKDVAEHREVGDVTTLADSSVMNLIEKGLDTGKSEDRPVTSCCPQRADPSLPAALTRQK